MRRRKLLRHQLRERAPSVVVRSGAMVAQRDPLRRDNAVSRARPLRPLIGEYTAMFDSTWGQVTRRKHRDDFARFVGWLEHNELPVTTASLGFMTLVDYVRWLRARPKVSGVGRGDPGAR